MNTAKETLKFLKTAFAESITANPIFKETYNSLIHKHKKIIEKESGESK
jgi:hypothetical protein